MIRHWTDAESDELDRQILASRTITFETNRTPRVPARLRPVNCLGCDRKLRSGSQPFTPGTVRHAGRGFCSTCYGHRRHQLDYK